MAKKKSGNARIAAASSSAAAPKWLLLRYEPVSLFSLRSTYSMSKGGKTLLVPTPYSVKMALIDAAFRFASPEDAPQKARTTFDLIKARRIRFEPPSQCVVQNTFVKIRQVERGADAGQYVSTIAYRELVYFKGVLSIAIDVAGMQDDQVATVVECAMHINYFGKRGSFFQFIGSDVIDQLPPGFSIALGESVESLPMGVYGVTQYLDDFGPELCNATDGFERISTYHDKDIKHGKHRILVSTLLPYRRAEATRSFTRYVTPPPQDQ